MDKRPTHWFSPVSDLPSDGIYTGEAIEYLKIWSGETFIHVNGTAYYHGMEGWDVPLMMRSGITHWRKVSKP